MTKQQIEQGVQKAVKDGADMQVWNAVAWLEDYGLIEWKDRCRIYDAITKARSKEA